MVLLVFMYLDFQLPWMLFPSVVALMYTLPVSGHPCSASAAHYTGVREPSLHPRDKSHLVMVCGPFHVLLGTIPFNENKMITCTLA